MPLAPRDHPTHTCALVSCTLSSEVPKPLQSAPAKPCGLKFFWGSMPPTSPSWRTLHASQSHQPPHSLSSSYAPAHFKLCCIQSCDGSRDGYYYTTVVIFPFCTSYYWQLMYVFDFVCFIPSKSQTIMPKSLTCGYSISVPDTSVVGYYTAPTHH